MSEEEEKAIDILINEIADIVVGEYCTHCKICGNENRECYYSKAIGTVCSIIIRQQKEIEELKKENFDTVYIQAIENYKTKIREKIKEYDKWIEKGEYTESLEAQRYALNELLEK